MNFFARWLVKLVPLFLYRLALLQSLVQIQRKKAKKVAKQMTVAAAEVVATVEVAVAVGVVVVVVVEVVVEVEVVFSFLLMFMNGPLKKFLFFRTS